MANVTLTPEVRDVLELAGGKWHRFKELHLFENGTHKLISALQSGVAIDEQKKFQAFYTPPPLAERVAELAMVKGQIVLEPSAGEGALVKACLAQGAKDVNCIELNPECRPKLEAFTHRVHIADFLQCRPEPGAQFTRIVMNPPFRYVKEIGDQDVVHVSHALRFLAPGGILVAIMVDNMGRKSFQTFTGMLDGWTETGAIYSFVKVPPKTFADTDIATIILKVKLPKPTVEEDPAKDAPEVAAIDDEQVIEQCILIIRAEQKASVGILQRRMRLGYTRAARIMDELERRGIVGPSKGPEPRDILVHADDIAPSHEPHEFTENLPAPEAKQMPAVPPPTGASTLNQQPLATPKPGEGGSTTDSNMKLTIPRADLAAAMAIVKSAARSKPDEKKPILSHVLVQANAKSVTLIATDEEITLRTNVDATVSKEGRITVKASLLHDIAAGTDGPEVALDLQRSTLHIASGSSKFRLTTLDAEDFPPFSRVKDPAEFALDDVILHSLLSRTIFAVSTDESRPVLCGSNLQLADGELTVTGCDGRRLAQAVAKVPVRNKLTCIIPARAAQQLLKLLANHDPAKPRQVEIAIGPNAASFTVPGRGSATTLVTRLIEGAYAPVHQIILPAKDPVCSIGRSLLLSAVDRVALVSDSIELAFLKQSVSISSSALGRGTRELVGEASDSLLVGCSREAKSILATPFLREALRANPAADELQFYTNGAIAMFKHDGWLAVIAGLTEKDEAKPADKPADAKK